MTQHSSAELHPVSTTSVNVPLSDRPLVADDQNTVVSSGGDDSQQTSIDLVLSATAQEIRERLFAGSDAPANSERGLRLGHFEVEEKIGAGGMGAVFRAIDLELSRYVALKVLHPATAADPALVARFRNEARACAQMNHDNVARVFFTGEQDGIHYIAYEYADGLTIKQLITQEKRLSYADTVNYAIQATLALIHIDASGVVHRDIKPSNIILTTTGRIKVVDLGLARRDTTDSIGDLTVAGTTLGTFDYIAPEQARDPRTADTRSDIYSLGCTVYHMLTGQPPYPEGTALQKLLDHQGKSPPDPRTVVPDVPEPLAAIVKKMMNTDPDQRYQDPGQLLADLISLASQMGLRSVPAEGIVWRRIPVRRIRELSGSIFVTAAVIAITVAALAMHFFPSGQDKTDAEIDRMLHSLLPPEENDPRVVEPPEPPEVDQGVAATEKTGDDKELTSGPPDETPASKTTLPPVPVLQSPFIVQSASGDVTRKPTLAAAWSNAKSGDEIILDFDGPLRLPTRCMPRLLSVESQIISIRAAPGRSPVLEFQGEESDDRSSTPGRLFNLSNDLNLKLDGVHLRVTVRSEVLSDQWVLFEFNGANRVELKNCLIEVQNPSHKKAAVFRLSDSTTGITDGDESVIRLDNVVIRGGCDFVKMASQKTGQVLATQCAFALDGSLINDIGSEAMLSQGSLTAIFKHTTSILSRPAFVTADSELPLDGGDPRRTVPFLSVESDSCVYASLTENGILVQSLGNDYLAQMQELFTWNGNHNLYHQIGTYWKLESGTYDIDTTSFLQDDWQEHWAKMAHTREAGAEEFSADVWSLPDQLPGLTRDGLAAISPGAFSLQRSFFFSPGNAARHSLNEEGRMPGVDAAALPKFPSSPQPVVPRPVTLETTPVAE